MFNLCRMRSLWLILGMTMLSGCQSLSQQSSQESTPVVNVDNLGDYYLYISGLDSDGLDTEVARQQQSAEQGDQKAALHLILLLSMPNTSASNPQLAKVSLDKVIETASNDDKGLLKLLSDQLEQRVQWLHKYDDLDDKHRRLQTELKKEQQDRIWLQQQKQSLEQQLQQLKAIERNILKREAESNGK